MASGITPRDKQRIALVKSFGRIGSVAVRHALIGAINALALHHGEKQLSLVQEFADAIDKAHGVYEPTEDGDE